MSRGESPKPIIVVVSERLLRLTLPDGRTATLLVGEASTVLAVGDIVVSSWDLAGRPYALVRESGTYRRGLDGWLLRKREATADEPRVRERLSAAEGAPIVEAARREADAACEALAAEVACGRGGGAAAAPADATVVAEAIARLRLVGAMDERALADDAVRFLAVCGPVGILPPDQYLSLVVRITEGCSWDACTFCSLYEGMPFRVRTRAEVARHAAALRAYFGPSLALRRSVFLGDANALCLSSDILLPRLDAVVEAFPGRPLYSFVDAWTGSRKAEAQWRACRERGLRRVYVGLETGDPALLARLGKPGEPQDAVRLVGSLHEAGVAAGVIVLLGAGGEAFAEHHAKRTADVLAAMSLGRDDIVYFSEYLPEAGRGHGREGDDRPQAHAGGRGFDLGPARTNDVVPGLAPEALARQRVAMSASLPGGAGGPRLASYDLREFTY